MTDAEYINATYLAIAGFPVTTASLQDWFTRYPNSAQLRAAVLDFVIANYFDGAAFASRPLSSSDPAIADVQYINNTYLAIAGFPVTAASLRQWFSQYPDSAQLRAAVRDYVIAAYFDSSRLALRPFSSSDGVYTPVGSDFQSEVANTLGPAGTSQDGFDSLFTVPALAFGTDYAAAASLDSVIAAADYVDGAFAAAFHASVDSQLPDFIAGGDSLIGTVAAPDAPSAQPTIVPQPGPGLPPVDVPDLPPPVTGPPPVGLPPPIDQGPPPGETPPPPGDTGISPSSPSIPPPFIPVQPLPPPLFGPIDPIPPPPDIPPPDLPPPFFPPIDPFPPPDFSGGGGGGGGGGGFGEGDDEEELAL